MFNLSLHLQCSTLAECFALSGKNGWDSQSFVDQLFTTEWGQNILKGISINEYSCEGFMYEGLLQRFSKVPGKVHSRNVLWFSGYLYRYLVAKGTRSLDEIHTVANLETIEKRFGFYHTQDWDYIEEDLWDRQTR